MYTSPHLVEDTITVMSGLVVLQASYNLGSVLVCFKSELCKVFLSLRNVRVSNVCECGGREGTDPQWVSNGCDRMGVWARPGLWLSEAA